MSTMSTSCTLDLLTYTYYTGPEGSLINGPNCHNCMNEIFHEGKLVDVQTVFVATPTGNIPFALRALMFNYGMQSPFDMTSFAEDFLLKRCTLCAQKATSMQVSLAVKEEICDVPFIATLNQDDDEGATNNTNRKRSIKMESKSEVGPEISSTSSVAKRLKSEPEESGHSSNNFMALPSDNTTLEVGEELVDRSYQIDKAFSSDADLRPGISCAEDSYDKKYELPFVYGRNPEEVKDPISIDDRRSINKFWKHANRVVRVQQADYDTSLTRVYFANQEKVTCKYCNMTFTSVSNDGYRLMEHFLSENHIRRIALAGLVFSHSEDFQKLVELCNETFKEVRPYKGKGHAMARIPFVSETSTNNIMRIEKLLHYLTLLKSSGLIDDGFSQYILRIYPSLRDINTCSLCETPVSCEQNADDYFNHFLSDSHVKKAMENRWNLGSNFAKLVKHLSKYLKENGRAEEADKFSKQLKSAAGIYMNPYKKNKKKKTSNLNEMKTVKKEEDE